MATPYVLLHTPYLNSRAFVHHGAPAGCRLRTAIPREAGPAILRGEAVAGIVPVGGLAQLGGQVELLGNFGISCPGASQSVLFFSHRPFDALDDSNRIRLSADSMSSVRLLYLLFAYGGGTAPRLAAPGAAPDGELVIGDAALRGHASGQYAYTTDLALRWQAIHGLPMVFARWVIHRNASRALRARLLWWLAAYAANEPALLARAAEDGQPATGLPPAAARRYLDGIRTVLRAEDLRGQQRYLADLQKHPLPGFLLPDMDLTVDSNQR